MKEIHLFYAPEASTTGLLPAEEASHAVRVLRLAEGDHIFVTDGMGFFHEAEITIASPKKCHISIVNSTSGEQTWLGEIHLAVAPTKNMDRMEWLAEKVTEIGINSFTFLNCQNSERRVLKTERITKIVISAMKQSHKAHLPAVNEMTDFKKFLAQPFDGEKFIAHCHNMGENTEAANHLPSLDNLLRQNNDKNRKCLILIGPEGDFSLEEVRMAEAAGFQSISLGRSRLRTETAALAAVHIAHLAHQP
jgi:16S rRNA (uracil1498-N3)-methyltransferase